MTQMQSEDGFVHLAYYRADKGLSFTWNGLKGAKADVSYGGSGEPVFATIGLGDFENAPTLGLAFGRFQEVCDGMADTFDIDFWQPSIDRAYRGEELPQRGSGYRSGVTAAGFTEAFEWPNEEGRWEEGDRYCEARVGASILRHAAAHGHRTDHVDFVIAVMREARRRFPRGGGEEHTPIGRLGASIAYWMA